MLTSFLLILNTLLYGSVQAQTYTSFCKARPRICSEYKGLKATFIKGFIESSEHFFGLRTSEPGNLWGALSDSELESGLMNLFHAIEGETLAPNVLTERTWTLGKTIGNLAGQKQSEVLKWINTFSIQQWMIFDHAKIPYEYWDDLANKIELIPIHVRAIEALSQNIGHAQFSLFMNTHPIQKPPKGMSEEEILEAWGHLYVNYLSDRQDRCGDKIISSKN